MPNQHTGKQPRNHLPHCPVIETETCPECGSAEYVRKGYGMERFQRICLNKIEIDGRMVPCAGYWEVPHVNAIQEGMAKRAIDIAHRGRGNPGTKRGTYKVRTYGEIPCGHCKETFTKMSPAAEYCRLCQVWNRKRLDKIAQEGRKKSG